MSRKNRSSIFTGIGVVIVIGCVILVGGRYFLNHRSVRTTITTGRIRSLFIYMQNAKTTAIQNNTPSATSSAIRTHTYARTSQTIAGVNAIAQTAGSFYNPLGNSPLNLGDGIFAEQNGAMGTLYLKWTEGHWTIRANLASPYAVTHAEQIVQHLHTHMLPTPQNKGIILIAQSNYQSFPEELQAKTTIAWQIDNKVCEIQQSGNPIEALKVAVNN